MTEVKVAVGDEVSVNQPLLITEAMKMETTIQAPFNGIIKQVTVANGDAIATGDLLIEIEKYNIIIKAQKGSGTYLRKTAVRYFQFKNILLLFYFHNNSY